ncbi:unnamed protein product [Somion occarium]|uniref:chitin deacetylase n=1 Tax=Somion occarium TaxID=3059160 RepID=A0ABP1D1L0_9APHY
MHFTFTAYTISVLSFIFYGHLTLPLVSAATLPGNQHDCNSHSKRLPSATWYQPDDHPVHQLFKRGPSAGTDGVPYAQVGSPAWSAAYPQSTPDANQLPELWVDALNSATAQGKIPGFAPSTPTDGNPVYPDGVDPLGNDVCSTTYKCRSDPDNIYDAPDGVMGISFDDGPLPSSSTKLYEFLQANKQRATHFFIGVNILQNPNEFMMAFETLQDDIAVHTWTHPHMTTLSNMDVLAQLGWTMEIIHNSTGGRLPKYWRPPFGDSDNRVNAIAKEVFGLKTIIWNQDTEDWSLRPKVPGLNILEHELTDDTVQMFIDAWPVIKENGWNTISVAEMDGGAPYQNSPSSSGNVQPAANIVRPSSVPSSLTSATSTAGTTTSSSIAQSLTDTVISTSTGPNPSSSTSASQSQTTSSASRGTYWSWCSTLAIVVPSLWVLS